MKKITAHSKVEDKLTALLEVQAAITALKLVEDRGLGTKSITEAKLDLQVFENQLTGYCTEENYKP
jgi:hypothetical protein